MESLDVVFIGYPNWWDTIPMPVIAFLSENDFSGKNRLYRFAPTREAVWGRRYGYPQALPAINHSG